MGISEITESKHLREYLGNFYKIYSIEKPIPTDLESWCRCSIGKQYLDWTMHKTGNLRDPEARFCRLYIRDPKRCTLFEIRWASIIKQVDKV